MITTQEIARLSQLRSKDYLISSLYLRLWPDWKIHQAKIKDLIKERREKFSEENIFGERRESVERDLENFRELAETFHETPYKGLVAFSCQAQGI